jgi:photosystem II stability/assembly factor-like uncharacterized protein
LLRAGIVAILVVLAVPAISIAQEVTDHAPPPDPAPAAGFPPMTPSVAKGESAPTPLQLPPPAAKALGGSWVAQGPGVAQSGQVEGIINSEVVGAIHTVAAHPTNPDILWVGAANGGIWKTTNATSASPNWAPQTDFEPSLSIGALELDPTDATNQTLVAGVGRFSAYSGNGGDRSGLFKTTDGGTTWNLLPAMKGRNISGVAPRGQTIVASVDVADVFNCGGGGNVGIWRSTDGGSTFGVITTGIPAAVTFDLASDRSANNVLYTGVTFGSACSFGAFTNGIYRSTNTGATWTKVSNAAMDALIIDGNLPGGTNNIEIAADGLDVFVNIINVGQSAGIFHSADGGTSWTAMDRPLTPEGLPVAIALPDTLIPGAPIIIDHSPSGFLHGLTAGMEVEVTGVAGTIGANGVWQITVINPTAFLLNGSSDLTPWTPGSGTWVKVAGLNPKVKPGFQGAIHSSIRTDPTTPSTVYLGGDRQDSPFPNFIGALDFSGRLFRGDAQVTATGAIPSPQWEHLTHSNSVVAIPAGGTANSSAPHADSREMVFDANGDLIQVDDGGVYRRTNPASNAGDWFSINGDIQVTEIHDVAWDAVSDIIISGNQDIGTTQQITTGGTTWDTIHTADGGDVAVDDTTMAGQSTRYSSFQYLANFRRREYDSSNTLLTEVFPTLITTPPDQALLIPFLTPVELNAIDQTWLVIGGCNAVYESFDQGDNLTQIPGLSNPTCSMGGIFGPQQNAIAYGGRSSGVGNKDVLYVGSRSVVYVRTTAHPTPLSVATSYPGTGVISDIVLDPDDWMTAFVIDPTKVYWTSDAGSTWTDITGNLTDTGLQSASYIKSSPDSLVVGGRMGVFELTLPPSSPYTWAELGAASLPNAPVWDLEFDVVDRVLVAGTLGRGAWTMQIPLPIIFADGFESGDTTAWSNTVP